MEGMDTKRDGHQLTTEAEQAARRQGAEQPGPDTYHPGNPDSVFAGALLSRGVSDDLHQGKRAGLQVGMEGFYREQSVHRRSS